jgi:hypothetical protein
VDVHIRIVTDKVASRLILRFILQASQDEDIYETVSEEQYKSIVKGRFAEDDFIGKYFFAVFDLFRSS